MMANDDGALAFRAINHAPHSHEHSESRHIFFSVANRVIFFCPKVF